MGEHPYDFAGTDRFRVVRQLGEGGTGVVYEAEDIKRGQRVALKTLKQHDLETLYRLKREFRALAGLSHPNLVDLYDMVLEGETCFFTMELVDGDNIIQYCRPDDCDGEDYEATAVADTMPGREVILHPQTVTTCHLDRLRQVLPQLVAGLATIHEAGLIHRDIKPSNVLIDEDGRVVLLDFGLVANLQDSVGDSLAGHIVGTVEYMAPEQASTGGLTAAADWYSVGVLLYEALTGRVPHSGSLMKILMGKQGYQPAPPRELVDGVPEDLGELCEELLARAPDLRPNGPALLRRLGVKSVPPREVHRGARAAKQMVPFAGRANDLRQLQHCFETVCAGRPTVAVVRGPSGMGKTALVRRFLDSLRVSHPDLVLLEGRCYESETVPYKAMDAVIDRLARHWSALPRIEAAALLPRRPSLLPRLFPMLGRVPVIAGAARESTTDDPQELRTQAFGALREVLQRLADRQRLVLFLDDLQWGDSDSMTLLAELLRPPDPPPMLLLLCHRDDRTVPAATTDDTSEGVPLFEEETDELDVLWRAIGPPTIAVDLGPLTRKESERLARHLLSDAAPELAERVAKESGGIPFFIAELGLFLKGAGDQDVGSLHLDDVLRERIKRLPGHARDLLEVVAVAGEPVSQRVAASALEQVSEDVARTIRRLRAEDLLRAPGGGGPDLVECYHDRIRECVRIGLSARRRQELYRGLAIALEQWSEGTAERSARYWRGAGERQRASEYARRAAEEASDKLDFGRAARLYRLSFELGKYDDAQAREISTALGDACQHAGRPGQAADAFLSAAKGARPAEALELRHRAAAVLLRGGYVEDGMRVTESVLAEIGLELAKTPRRALLSVAWRRAWLRVRGLGYRRRAESDIPRRVLTLIDVCGSVAEGLGLIDTIRGAAIQARYIMMALRCGEPSRVGRALAIEAGYQSATGPAKRARELADKAERLAGDLGDTTFLPVVNWARGSTFMFADSDWRAALGAFDEAIRVLRSNRQTGGWEMVTAQMYRCVNLLRLGELRELAEKVLRQLGHAERRGDLYAAVNLRIRFNIIWLMRDEVINAERDLEGAIAAWLPAASTSHLQHAWAMIARCELALYRGEPTWAREHLEQGWGTLTSTQLFRVAPVRVDCYYVRGRTAIACATQLRRDRGDEGESAEVEQLLKEVGECVRRLEHEKAPVGAAYALLLRAGTASVRGERAQTLSALREVLGISERLEMALNAACVRLWLGKVLGAMDGDTMRSEAELWMREQGVANPVALAFMYAPGLFEG